MAIKYRELYMQLLNTIEQGQLKPGDKLPTEAELASQGYSRNTVRQALELLADEGRIIKRRGSGSIVTPKAANPGTGNVAVIVQDFNTSDFPKLIGGIADGLRGWGAPLLYSARGRLENEAAILTELQGKEIDGILVNAMFSALPNPNLPLYQEFIDHGIPVIFLFSSYAGLNGSLKIVHDDVAGGALAVSHLYERGRRRPCGIFTSDFTLGLLRFEGYFKQCQAFGLEIRSDHVLWLNSRDYQQEHLIEGRVLQLVDNKDSIVCQNDFIAHTVIKLLTKAGIKVPQDIAVISFDNNYLCNYPPVPFTSLEGNAYDSGKLAAIKLKRILSGYKETDGVLPWTIIKREST